MSAAALLAGLAAVCGVLAVWEAIAAAEQERLVRAAMRWLAPARAALRANREPTSPERRRLVLVGGLSSSLPAGSPPGRGRRWCSARPRRGWRARCCAAAMGAAARAIAAEAPAIARAARRRALRRALGARGAVRRRRAAPASAGPPATSCARSRPRSSSANAPTTSCGSSRHGRAPGRATRSPPRSCCNAMRAATSRGCCARSPPRSRPAAACWRRLAPATAQARFTALLVSGLPLAGLALAELAQPGFVAALVGDPRTGALVAVALVLQAVAFACVRRIARVGEGLG